MSTELAHTFTTFEQAGPDGLVLRGISSPTTGRLLELKPIVDWLGLVWKSQRTKVTQLQKKVGGGRVVYRPDGDRAYHTYVSAEVTQQWLDNLSTNHASLKPGTVERIDAIRRLLRGGNGHTPLGGNGHTPLESTPVVGESTQLATVLDRISITQAEIVTTLVRLHEAQTALTVRDEHKGQALADQQRKMARYDAMINTAFNDQHTIANAVATVDQKYETEVAELVRRVAAVEAARAAGVEGAPPGLRQPQNVDTKGWIPVSQYLGERNIRPSPTQRRELFSMISTAWRTAGNRRVYRKTEAGVEYNIYPPDELDEWFHQRRTEVNHILTSSTGG